MKKTLQSLPLTNWIWSKCITNSNQSPHGPCLTLRPHCLPPFLLSQRDELIDFLLLRHPRFFPQLFAWPEFSHNSRLSSNVTCLESYTQTVVSEANHVYNCFFFHHKVRFSSGHYMKLPYSFTCGFPSLSATISFSFLAVHGSKDFTCHMMCVHKHAGLTCLKLHILWLHESTYQQKTQGSLWLR